MRCEAGAGKIEKGIDDGKVVTVAWKTCQRQEAVKLFLVLYVS